MEQKEKYDFKAIGLAIKEGRKAKGLSRNQLAEELNIAPRYIASIENSGQHPSLQIFYELVTFLDISVDTFFFPDKEVHKTTQRRQLDRLRFAGVYIHLPCLPRLFCMGLVLQSRMKVAPV